MRSIHASRDYQPRVRTPLAAILSRGAAAPRVEVLDSISAGVQRMSRMMTRVLLLGRAMRRCWISSHALVPALFRQLYSRAVHPGGRCDVVAEWEGRAWAKASTARSCCATSSATCTPTRSSTRPKAGM